MLAGQVCDGTPARLLFDVQFMRLTAGYGRVERGVKPVAESSSKRSPARSSAEAAFFAALRELYVHAGEPSTRSMAQGIGDVSHTTLHAAIRGTTVPSWPVVEKLVRFLGGDLHTFQKLWADTRPNANLRRPVSGPEVSVFVSYARIDDKATYSRVSQLIDSFADSYESMTGGTVGVFKDVESIKPGDDWRDRIRLGLAASSIFLAVISPAYLRSAECRQELSEFLTFLDVNSSARLVIPLIFATPDRIQTEFADDALWKRIEKLQWLNISDLRHTDPGTSGWIIAVDRIADRVDEVLQSFRSENVVVRSEDVQIEHQLSQGDFDLEHMADIEEKLPVMGESLTMYGKLMEQMNSEVNASTPAMQRADTFAKKLAVSNQLAEKLNPIADEMDSAASHIVAYLDEMSYVANFFVAGLRRASEGGASEAREFMTPEIVEFLTSMKIASTQGINAVAAIEVFVQSLSQVIGFSKRLDLPLKKIRNASLKVADIRGVLTGWQEEVSSLQDLYPDLDLTS